MKIDGQLTEADLIEFIGLKWKVETIKSVLSSSDYNDTAKLLIVKGLLEQED